MEEIKLEKNLKEFVGKDVLVNIDGCLQGKYSLSNMTYFVNEDILTLKGEENYLKINLNQVYKFEMNSVLEIGIDNDIVVTIERTKGA